VQVIPFAVIDSILFPPPISVAPTPASASIVVIHLICSDTGFRITLWRRSGLCLFIQGASFLAALQDQLTSQHSLHLRCFQFSISPTQFDSSVLSDDPQTRSFPLYAARRLEFLCEYGEPLRKRRTLSGNQGSSIYATASVASGPEKPQELLPLHDLFPSPSL